MLATDPSLMPVTILVISAHLPSELRREYYHISFLSLVFCYFSIA